ncbi:MAG: hypothetical protein K1W33_07495 [Clostridia bacterium]|nr:hypothetical protein [Clostridia bacterium]
MYFYDDDFGKVDDDLERNQEAMEDLMEEEDEDFQQDDGSEEEFDDGGNPQQSGGSRDGFNPRNLNDEGKRKRTR